MGDIKKIIRNYFWPLFLKAIPIGCFFLFCIYGKLQADLTAGKIESILVRLCFVTICSFFIAWRLPGALSVGRREVFRQISIMIIFFGVLYCPLVSQLSYIGRSIKAVKHEITKEHKSKPDKIFALLKEFPAVYEKYMDNHFNLSKKFVHLDALVKVYVLGVSPNNNVAVGRNGFYFEGWGARKVEQGIVENFDNIADYMGQIPFTEDELKQWQRTLEERKYWLRERGVEYVFVLAPTKALVYPEFLPLSLQKAVTSGRTTRYKQLTDHLRQHADIHFIDLLPSLLEAKRKRDYPLLFYKTDFHWNFYGAFVAYQTIIDSLKEMFPVYDLPHPSFSEFDLSIDEHWAHHRFMNMVGLPESLNKNEHYITMVPKKGGRWDSATDIPAEGIHDVYPPERPITAENGSSMDIRLILNAQASIPSVLLLGDSFFEKCVYFFSGDARRVLNFRTIVNFPDKIFDYETPSIVIQEILNMFILRKPPENPAGFNVSYLKGKFADSKERVLIKGGSTVFRAYGTRMNLVIPGPLAARKDSTRILRFSGEGLTRNTVTIQFSDDAGHLVQTLHREVRKGSNEWYIELPKQTIGVIDISADSRIQDFYIPEQVEVSVD